MRGSTCALCVVWKLLVSSQNLPCLALNCLKPEDASRQGWAGCSGLDCDSPNLDEFGFMQRRILPLTENWQNAGQQIRLKGSSELTGV